MISGLNHITLAVKDVDKSFDFYSKVIGLKPLVKWDKGAYFLAGDFWFCINKDDLVNSRNDYTHYAFSVSHEQFKLLSEKLINSGVTIFKENTSPGDSLYFLDPDGHKLEIHVGNWRLRLNEKMQNPGSWKNVIWF